MNNSGAIDSALTAILQHDDLDMEKLSGWTDTLSKEEAAANLQGMTVLFHNLMYKNKKRVDEIYGSSSEGRLFDPWEDVPPDELQKYLDKLRAEQETEPDEMEIKAHKRRKNKSSGPLDLSKLKRTVIEVNPDGDPDFEKNHPGFKKIGYEDSCEVIIVPAQTFVLVHRLNKFARTDENGETEIICAKRPVEKLVPGSVVSPELASHIIYNKVILGLPLYRQAQDFERNGFNLSRQTMCNWSMAVSEQYLGPLYERMKKDMANLERVHIDETPLQVIQNHAKGGNKMGNIMVGRSTWNDPVQMAVYAFNERKSQETFEDLLPLDYSGTIICDAAPSHGVFKNADLAFCMAHARRKFVEAIKSRADYKQFQKLASGSKRQAFLEKNTGLSFGLNVLVLFGQLYAQERKSLDKQESSTERLIRRQEKSLPVFNRLAELIKAAATSFLPKTPLYEASEYFLNQEEGLRLYLSNGDIPIDNNPAERMVKPFVMARKNFLFSNTSRGAQSTAVCFSIMESAVLNKLRPEAYLTYVLDRLRRDGLRDEVVEELLPYSGKLPDELYLEKEEKNQKKS